MIFGKYVKIFSLEYKKMHLAVHKCFAMS